MPYRRLNRSSLAETRPEDCEQHSVTSDAASLAAVVAVRARTHEDGVRGLHHHPCVSLAPSDCRVTFCMVLLWFHTTLCVCCPHTLVHHHRCACVHLGWGVLAHTCGTLGFTWMKVCNQSATSAGRVVLAISVMVRQLSHDPCRERQTQIPTCGGPIQPKFSNWGGHNLAPLLGRHKCVPLWIYNYRCIHNHSYPKSCHHTCRCPSKLPSSDPDVHR